MESTSLNNLDRVMVEKTQMFLNATDVNDMYRTYKEIPKVWNYNMESDKLYNKIKEMLTLMQKNEWHGISDYEKFILARDIARMYCSKIYTDKLIGDMGYPQEGTNNGRFFDLLTVETDLVFAQKAYIRYAENGVVFQEWGES